MSTVTKQSDLKIGVMDSGVGGLTVVKELEALVPNESFIYAGDNANCPYGNRGQDEIEALARRMLDFLQKQGVKAVAVACNTISTLIDRYAKDYPFPVFSIIKPAADYVVRSGIREVGVIATEFTIKTGCYTRLIHEGDPTIEVYGEPSRDLAMLVDRGDFDMAAIEADIRNHVGALRKAHPVKDIILGCTHFPIVQDVFQRAAPDVRFINPAREQALAVKRCLEERGLSSGQARHGFDVYTSGSTKVYETILGKLGITAAAKIQTVRF